MQCQQLYGNVCHQVSGYACKYRQYDISGHLYSSRDCDERRSWIYSSYFNGVWYPGQITGIYEVSVSFVDAPATFVKHIMLRVLWWNHREAKRKKSKKYCHFEMQKKEYIRWLPIDHIDGHLAIFKGKKKVMVSVKDSMHKQARDKTCYFGMPIPNGIAY